MLYLEIERVWRADNTGEDLVVRLKTATKVLALGRAGSIEGVDRIIHRELGEAGYTLEQRWT